LHRSHGRSVEVEPELPEDRLRGSLTRADAIGDADTAIGVAGQSQTAVTPKSLLDVVHQVEVPDGIMRHRRGEARKMRQQGGAAHTDQRAEIAKRPPDNLPIRESGRGV